MGKMSNGLTKTVAGCRVQAKQDCCRVAVCNGDGVASLSARQQFKGAITEGGLTWHHRPVAEIVCTW